MLTNYKTILAFIGMLMLLMSTSAFAQEVGEILWEDNFNDTATDSACLVDVGWIYYNASDGLEGSVVKQTNEGTAYLQTGNFLDFVGAVVIQSNGVPEMDTLDDERARRLLIDSSKGAPNSEITFNINFKKIESSFFTCGMRMVQRDTSETIPDSDPSQEGAYQLYMSPLENIISISRVLGVDEGGAEFDFFNPNKWEIIDSTTIFEFEQNIPYWVKFYMYENNFKMKIWEGELSDEEDGWMLDETVDSARVSGTFTQFALLSPPPNAASTDQIEIDNIVVRSTGTHVDVEKPRLELPSKFELMANYPNPFNPTTNIQFALPANSNVKLTVVNALGQVVAELVNGELSAGIHNVSWNATNMTSGIYFYTIQADNFVQTRKMLLIK